MEIAGSRFDDLVRLMARLRAADGGCPWDREQTPESLRRYVVEEAYEVVDAVEAGDPMEIKGELGDLLFQIIFMARLFEEQGRFAIHDVEQGILDKMIRRHPHVFGSATARSADDVVSNWIDIKKREGAPQARSGDADSNRNETLPPANGPSCPGEARSVLDGVPKTAPALLRAFLLSERAARIGFDWTGALPVVDKLQEELDEVRRSLESGDADGIAGEIGDLFFAMASLSRKLGVQPEVALQSSNSKFDKRFRHVEASLSPDEKPDMDRLEELWQKSKRQYP